MLVSRIIHSLVIVTGEYLLLFLTLICIFFQMFVYSLPPSLQTSREAEKFVPRKFMSFQRRTRGATTKARASSRSAETKYGAR